MKGSIVEGACYAVMAGLGEAYFVADAVRLGATPLALGLVIALPLFVGSTGAIISHSLGSRGVSRRRTAVAGTTGQVVALAATAFAEYSGVLSPNLLIALVSAYYFCGQLTGVAWASWFGDIVPEEERGAYFSRRNRVVHAVICLSVLAGGGCLHVLEGKGLGAGIVSSGNGFVVIFALAAFARLVSTVLLARTAEPRLEAIPSNPLRSLRSAVARGSFARRVVLIAASLHFGVYIVAPYFAPYMLETLQFSYLEYTLVNVTSVVARVTLLPTWGRLLDQHAARSSFLVSLVGIAILPIPWLLSGHLAVILFAQLLAGVFWGGHELSEFSMILESVDRSQRVAVFAALGALAGAAQLAGTLVGSVLFGWGGIVVALAVSTGVRGVVAIVAPPLVPAVSPRPHAPRRVLLLRLAGWRPSGGLTHRPLPVSDRR